MKQRNLWPFGVILAFALFISGTAGLIVLAASNRMELVAGNYYEQEVRYQTRLDSLERANRLTTPGWIRYETDRDRIVVGIPGQHRVEPVVGRVELYRPAAAGLDQRIDLQPDVEGRQVVDAASLAPGAWRVVLLWNFQGHEYCVEQKIVVRRK